MCFHDSTNSVKPIPLEYNFFRLVLIGDTIFKPPLIPIEIISDNLICPFVDYAHHTQHDTDDIHFL